MEIKDSDLVYVKENLVIEPLVDNWYAWSHLIPPATAALNILGRHLKIMDSYIQNPQIHMAAVKNPQMLGGPFIDLKSKQTTEVQLLRDQTLTVCSDLLQLCDEITRLNKLLGEQAKGQSLSPLYAKVPDSLRGFVELFYDVNNNPSYRFFESLIYNSKFYKESLQSFNLFLVLSDDSRSFVLSTPRLPDEEILRLNIPFKDKRIDRLFEMTHTPKEFSYIRDLLEITPAKEHLFRELFTTTPPPPYKKYTGNGVLTRYFGHACILVETRDISILVDPVVSYGYESDISRYTFPDLPETIDYVLITHNHQDHILFETLLRIRHKVKHIVVPKNGGGVLQDPNLKLMFEKLGFENVIELGEMERLPLKDCTIMGIPFMGEHADLDIRSKLCHFVEFKNEYKVLFAADSCNHETKIYENIHAITGDVNIFFLGMECDGAPLSWLYGPLLPQPVSREKDQSRRLAGCNYEQSRALIEVFRPRDVFIYAMGMEPWLKFISSIKYTAESRPIIESNKVLDYCRTTGVDAERLFGEKIIEYKTTDPILNNLIEK